ncbi:alpha 1 4-glycosyltransferase family protein [Euphorbia peplus]|nr:alpha 1 4-glycosyltransferase family protein [Euphorbia peplus]
MRKLKLSPQVLDAKKISLSVIVITALIFLFFADSVLYNDFLHSSSVNEVVQGPEVVHIKSTIARLELLSTREDVDQVRTDDHHLYSLIPPSNVTVDERIKWFRNKLPEYDHIFKSDNSSRRRFHRRTREFFNNECEVQFFMTWISPASSFGGRDFLGMETLFKVHPNGCLMILSESLDSRQGYRILKQLVNRGFKVAAVKPDLEFLFRKTPAETWFDELKSGNKDPGEIPLPQNLSNLIRLAVLYKYGGVYLDTDFIVLKSFSGLRNSIGAQSVDADSKNWTRLNNAVLVFDKKHPLLFRFIQEFAATFDGNKWGHNGPYLVSRVVQKVSGKLGYNFTVLSPMAFYPVGWTKIAGLFKKPENRAESKWVQAKLLQLSGDTYAVHLWNKQSSKIRIEEGSIMATLISDHCSICEYVHSY